MADLTFTAIPVPASVTLQELIAERRISGRSLEPNDLAEAMLRRWGFDAELHASGYALAHEAAAQTATNLLAAQTVDSLLTA